MKELLEYLARSIADNKDQIQVLETASEYGGANLTLISDPADTGRLIGKNGITAFALKNLLKLKSGAERKRFFLEIKSNQEATEAPED